MLRGCLTRIGYADCRYDIEVQPRDRPAFHVEVKWDKRAGTTGNLYFEVENTRRRTPSGVRATSADWWCHVLGDGDEALLVRVADLRARLDSGTFRSVQTTGADSNSRGLLVPRATLEGLPLARWVRLPTVDAFFGEVFRDRG